MKQIIYLSLFLLLIAVALFQNLLFLAAIFSVLFTWWFGAVWLVLLAVLVDAYFGAFAGVPVFSLIALVWFAISELMRPAMRIMK